VPVSGLPGDARRVLIYGVTGSGKTMLAARLADLTGIEWHSVDDLTWEPGWVEVPVDEQRSRIQQICVRPQWILDTAYGKWLDLPLRYTQLIVALDYPRWFSFQRLVRRTVTRLFDRRLVCNGNRESLRGLFSRDGIIVWHFRSFDRKRQRILRWCNDPTAPPIMRFTSSRQTEQWLSGLRERALKSLANTFGPLQPSRTASIAAVVHHRNPTCCAGRGPLSETRPLRRHSLIRSVLCASLSQDLLSSLHTEKRGAM
jgi:adenylate kinase family enzyme